MRKQPWAFGDEINREPHLAKLFLDCYRVLYWYSTMNAVALKYSNRDWGHETALLLGVRFKQNISRSWKAEITSLPALAIIESASIMVLGCRTARGLLLQGSRRSVNSHTVSGYLRTKLLMWSSRRLCRVSEIPVVVSEENGTRGGGVSTSSSLKDVDFPIT